MCYLHKIWYVLSIIPYKTQECPEFSQILGGNLVLYSPYFLRIGCHAFSINDVPLVLN